MTAGTDALKTGFVTALVDSAPFSYCSLMARGIGTEYHFGSPVNMTVRQESAWADLGIYAQVSYGYDDAGVLYPLWLGLTCFWDGWKRREHFDET